MTNPFIVTKPIKSIGTAILLVFLFGPIGLFYASVSGGLIMTFTPIFLFLLFILGSSQTNLILTSLSLGLLIIFALTYWAINIVWAIISVSNYNKKIENEAHRQFELWDSLHDKNQNQFVVNVIQKPPKVDMSEKEATVSSTPSLQEWAKNNPGKSINDYYSKFGR